MFEGITLGQYVPGQSLVHRLDPRTKLGLTLLFSVLAFVPQGPAGLGVVALFSLAAAVASRIPFAWLMRGLRPLWFVLLFTTVVNLFATPGTPLVGAGWLTVTQEGLYRALLVGTRLLILVLTVSLLTLTTPPLSLTEGLERMLRPFRRVGLPAHELALMMTIALRFIPTLLEETNRIIRAQQSRGADFASGGPVRRARAFVPVLIPLFVAAFRRADELATAMEARGYRGVGGRTRMRQLTYTRLDLFAALASALWATALVAISLKGW